VAFYHNVRGSYTSQVICSEQLLLWQTAYTVASVRSGSGDTTIPISPISRYFVTRSSFCDEQSPFRGGELGAAWVLVSTVWRTWDYRDRAVVGALNIGGRHVGHRGGIFGICLFNLP
jgi:hypothetical protein